ncbi:MAG: PKD domain-containing protein [Chitinophagales bacterium]
MVLSTDVYQGRGATNRPIMYLLIRNIRLVMILLLVPIVFVSAGNDKDKSKKRKATKTNNVKKAKDLAPVTSYPTKPIFDKEACDLKLDFNLNINGLAVSFEDKSQGKYTDIEWMFGDGNSAKTNSIKHTYTQAGIYYFTATLYNSETGCIDFVAGNYYVSADSQVDALSRQDVNGAEVINLKKDK